MDGRSISAILQALSHASGRPVKAYGQSTTNESGFKRVRLSQILNFHGVEFLDPSGDLPDIQTQRFLVFGLFVNTHN